MENPKLTKQAYWEAAKSQNLIPNFWMSEEYLEKAEFPWYRDSEWCGWQDPTGIGWFFPSLNSQGQFTTEESDVYAGFLQEQDRKWLMTCMDKPSYSHFLDYQFIYDPQDFLKMEGSQWRVFRKNIRKYPKRSSANLFYRKIDFKNTHDREAIKLLLQWAGDKEFFDNEVMIRYILEGCHRWGLFADEKLVGMNVFDENWMFINFRYCIDDGTPFLNEYMRYLFYTSDIITMKNKLVNDGGSLGNEGLRRFKMKLNPCKIYVVTSYEQEKSNENQS